MTERQYLEKRYALVNKMTVAKACHCYRVARAREREIAKLDEEYNKQNESLCT